LLPALPFGHHQLSCTISHRIGQAAEILLGHVSDPTRLCKLTLKKGDLLDKAFYVFTSGTSTTAFSTSTLDTLS
jgi:hypothetical protein